MSNGDAEYRAVIESLGYLDATSRHARRRYADWLDDQAGGYHPDAEPIRRACDEEERLAPGCYRNAGTILAPKWERLNVTSWPRPL